MFYFWFSLFYSFWCFLGPKTNKNLHINYIPTLHILGLCGHIILFNNFHVFVLLPLSLLYFVWGWINMLMERFFLTIKDHVDIRSSEILGMVLIKSSFSKVFSPNTKPLNFYLLIYVVPNKITITTQNQLIILWKTRKFSSLENLVVIMLLVLCHGL